MRGDLGLENLVLQHILRVATAVSHLCTILKVYGSENECVRKLSFRV